MDFADPGRSDRSIVIQITIMKKKGDAVEGDSWGALTKITQIF